MHELNARQIELEQLFNKNQLIPRMRKEFTDCKEFDFVDYIKKAAMPVMFGIDLLVQMALHKRADLVTLIGCLRHHFDDGQKTADAIYKAAELDLLDYDVQTETFVLKFSISVDVQAELDRFQFPLPMIVLPMVVTNNKETGYISSKGSIILRQNHHDDDVCLDHVNRMNRVAFTINQNTARMVKNSWRNLDKPKAGETKKDFERRKRAFDKYDRTTKDIMALMPDVFYLTHKYDKRGRFYCQGYHITYQGAPWNKAVIEFAEKELIE